MASGQGTRFGVRKSVTAFFEQPYRILSMALGWVGFSSESRSKVGVRVLAGDSGLPKPFSADITGSSRSPGELLRQN